MLLGRFNNQVIYCITTVDSFCKYQTANKKKKNKPKPEWFSASHQYSVQVFEKKKVISCESEHLF